MREDRITQAKRNMAEQQEVLRDMGPYMTLGIQLVLTILVFLGSGIGWINISRPALSGQLFSQVLGRSRV